MRANFGATCHRIAPGYAYDFKGQLTGVSYPGQTTPVTYTYDDAGRLHTATDWLGNQTTFNDDANSNLTSEVFPSASGVTDTFTPDAAGQLTSISDA